ncbi:hypothetical protein JYP49_10755 [Nitratireductor aquimarinus]|uniref:hypothetical protein n=1 Tax=Nitratireductor TaxID=245876 RepID=UPI0019D33988|nr:MULTISPECIES: hypothetical protein [Nitratireductor]MBN7777399.1 hypothetical protein [Nitratireductor pacificus]MBN7781070.1 hypothetical protein [Nitratireductor pacificus]MBN7789876.1 hypothetical protein [Nitratireductor aquimarinus]MBY6099608.1 hypothetical protein [Nitratireductor aquimarinus]MCA1262813.1 hypothetical protein [Nitratireductor aquimarinus]
MYRRPSSNVEQSEQADAKALRKITAAIVFSTAIIFFKKLKNDKDSISFLGFSFESIEHSHVIGLIYAIILINILMFMHYTMTIFAFGPYKLQLKLSERLIYGIRNLLSAKYKPRAAKKIVRFIITLAMLPSVIAAILGLYVISLGLYLGFSDFIKLIEAVWT